MTTKSTLLYEMNITRQEVGAHLGGTKGLVVECPKCGKSACLAEQRVKDNFRIKKYAHQVGVDASERGGSWSNLCIVKEPRL